MKLTPAGKWYWIEPDPLGVRIITVPGEEERPYTGVVIARGPRCEVATQGARILFQKNTAQEIMVDDTRVTLVHEDQVLAVLAAPQVQRAPTRRVDTFNPGLLR